MKNNSHKENKNNMNTTNTAGSKKGKRMPAVISGITRRMR